MTTRSPQDKERYVADLIARENQFIHDVLDRPGDLLALVLRWHLMSENKLDRIIVATLAHPERLADARFSFQQKLSIVNAMGKIDDHTAQALRLLNALRNKCAHDLQRDILEADVAALGRCYGREQYAAAKARHAANPLQLLFANVFGWVHQDLIVAAVAAEHRRSSHQKPRGEDDA